MGSLESLEGLKVNDDMFYVRIENCNNLQNVSSLNNLITVGLLWLNHFDISFVRNIEKISDLQLRGNGQVQNLSDFGKLKEIRSFTLTRLEELEDLNFLRTVNRDNKFRSILLINNPELSDISTLSEFGKLLSLIHI